jgi:hypothetical protein
MNRARGAGSDRRSRYAENWRGARDVVASSRACLRLLRSASATCTSTITVPTVTSDTAFTTRSARFHMFILDRSKLTTVASTVMHEQRSRDNVKFPLPPDENEYVSQLAC